VDVIAQDALAVLVITAGQRVTGEVKIVVVPHHSSSQAEIPTLCSLDGDGDYGRHPYISIALVIEVIEKEQEVFNELAIGFQVPCNAQDRSWFTRRHIV
jgi:hypothetical protein